ncbi:MAG: hypothetical protein ABJK17_00465, partial [Ascidiaceihabitans sp.]|uniref:hypothetical protein n=1 Tax=Ascidiaceihabitans sp. TaxID=1872644 RepID=UPI0032993D38
QAWILEACWPITWGSVDMFAMTFMTVVIGVLTYGSIVIIAWHCGLPLPLFHNAVIMVVMTAGPPLLLISASFALSRVRFWRKMAALAQIQQLGHGAQLTRGQRFQPRSIEGKSTLEYLLGAIIWVGVFSLPYWLNLPRPEVWAIGCVCLWKLLKWSLPG